MRRVRSRASEASRGGAPAQDDSGIGNETSHSSIEQKRVPCQHERAARRRLAGPGHRRARRGALPRRAGASSRSPSSSSSSTRDPVRYSRDASRYLRDVFDHYGTTAGPATRGASSRASSSSTCPGSRPTPARGRCPRGALVGQEHVQEEIYRALSNFVREGRPNRLVLLHGPNGSAKSTIAACIMAALEHYSTLDEGRALPLSLGLPVAEDPPRLARLRAASKARAGSGRRRTRTSPTKRSTRSSSSRCATTRSFSSRSPSGERLLEAALQARRGVDRAAQRLDPARAALAQEPAGLRGAARVVRRLVHRGAQARAGRALLHLAPLPRRRRHHRPAAQRRRGRAADHDGPLARSRCPRRSRRSRSTRRRASSSTPRAASSSSAISSSARSTRSSTCSSRSRRARSRSPQQNVQLNCVMMGSANELHLDAFREHAGVRELPRAARARAGAVPAELRAGAAHLRHARRAAGAPARRAARDRDGGDSSRSSRGCASRTPTATRARSARSCRRSRRVEKADLYALGKRARAPRRRQRRSSSARHVKRRLDRERLVPHLRGAHRREPARDARRAARRRAVDRLQVPQPAGRARRDRGALPAQERVRVAPAGRDRRRLPRREAFREHAPRAPARRVGVRALRRERPRQEEQYAELFERYVQHVSVWVKKERTLQPRHAASTKSRTRR